MEETAALLIASYSAWVRRWIGPTERSVCIHDGRRVHAVSDDLALRGIVAGELLARVRELAPDASFHRHDPHLDAAVWEDLLAVLAEVAPRLRTVAQGCVVLEPWDMPALKLLNETFGTRLGIARTSFLARLAAQSAKPGAINSVARRDEERFLCTDPVRHLIAFGIDPGIVDRLALFGLTTVKRAASLSRRHLAAQFGTAGEALFDLLHPHGPDPPIPIHQPPPAVAAAFAFNDPVSEPGEILPLLDRLVAEAVQGLGARRAQILTLRIDGIGLERSDAARRVLKVPTARAEHFRTVARTLFDGLLPPCSGPAPLVLSIALTLGGLTWPDGVQGGLFDDRPALTNAVRTLNRRYPGRLLRASITDMHAYLPECGVRYEPYNA
ncbi:MAG TPA: hypothetical protein VHI13_00660 [Candidatus Kapabacteria bacterium]|nr:hypothetical protein [Candidatus Kapabacteria bacterium]